MPSTNDKNSFLYVDGKIHYGLETPSVTQSTYTGKTTHYDVIVIGAGFAGLCAARDISRSGKSVLLIEARDRIGGRTYTSPRHGHNLEMGGTWVHWLQPHVFHEIHQYGLQGQLKRSIGTAPPNCSPAGPEMIYFPHNGNVEKINSGEYGEKMNAAMKAFCDVDGDGGRLLFEFPYSASPNDSPELKRLDGMSIADRIAELRGKISDEEIDIMAGFFASIGCCSLDKISAFDAFKWWSLPGHDVTALMAAVCYFKLKCGTTKLAQSILSEFRGDTLFSAPVSNIQQSGQLVTVTTRTGVKVTAAYVVSCVPLNVLHSISFSPPLSNEKFQASQLGHSNKAAKIHMYTKTHIPAMFTMTIPPSPILFGFSETDLPTSQGGGSFTVYFTQSELFTTSSAESIVQGFKNEMQSSSIVPEKLTPDELICHNWTQDEFARGLWCAYPPGFGDKYFEALQKPEGRVYFASADWADGWRGFIDGAIEQGCKIARSVAKNFQEVGYIVSAN